MLIQLLGAPAILVDGRRLEHPSKKAMALLAYLAMRADEHVSRSHLASLLWGDSGEEQARANLRQTLSQLRKLFQSAGRDPILVPFDKIVLTSAGLEVDARRILSETARLATADLARLPVFLEGLDIQAPEFDSWLAAQRRMIRSRLAEHLQQRAAEANQAGAHGEAVDALTAALALDPLKEPLHHLLIETLAAEGRTDEALKQYEACRAILARELQIEPQAATRSLAARIRRDRMGHHTREDRGPAPARPEAAALTIVVAEQAGKDRHVQIFDTARDALTQALALSREGDPQQRPRLAVLPASGNAAADDAAAAALIMSAEHGQIAVSAEVFAQFQRHSPFMFSTGRAQPDGASTYILVSEISNHRLLVMPTVTDPVASSVPDFSVAVLPLVDRSRTADPLGIGEMVAEDIIHRLSRYRGLTVAAPSASNAFRVLAHPAGRARGILGVNYLVDGTILRDGGRLHIHISLTDLRVNHLVFSHKFDGSFPGAVFDHGELADQLASIIFHKAQGAEMLRAERAPTENSTALEWYLRGLASHRRSGILVENARHAFHCFSEAIALDPQFARAIAWRLCAASWFDRPYLVDPGMRQIQDALAIDEEDAEIHRIAGALQLYFGDKTQALRHMERAIALNPSDAYLLATSAVYWAFCGEPDKGLAVVERAMQLDHFLPAWCVEGHGIVLYTMGAFEQAAESVRRLVSPRPRALAYLAACETGMGRHEAARRTVGRLRSVAPQLTREQFLSTEYYLHQSDKDALGGRLAAAGFA